MAAGSMLGQHVFVLEQQPDLCFALREPIEKAGHHLHHFADVEVLIDQMDALSDNCGGLAVINADAVTGDVGDTIRRIKAHTYAVDVIVVCKHPSHEEVISALRAMASDVITRAETDTEVVATVLRRLHLYPWAAADLVKAYQDRYGVFRKYQDDMFTDLRNRIMALSHGALTDRKKPKERPTILVLEDEPDLRDNMSIILGEHYTVLGAADGEEALGLVRAHPEIACAILDIHVPKLKGDVLLALLKVENPLCQVIVLTGFKESDIALKVFKDGACDYLNKPVTDAQILASVQEALTVRQNTTHSSAYLAFDERMRLFRLFCETAIAAHEGVTYGDLWAFFPETKMRTSRAAVTIPTSELSAPNVLPFVQREMDQVKACALQTQQELIRKWCP